MTIYLALVKVPDVWPTKPGNLNSSWLIETTCPGWLAVLIGDVFSLLLHALLVDVAYIHAENLGIFILESFFGISPLLAIYCKDTND